MNDTIYNLSTFKEEFNTWTLPFFFWESETKTFTYSIPLEHLFNPFHATGLFLYPLKTENQRFSDVFSGYRKRPNTWNGWEKKRCKEPSLCVEDILWQHIFGIPKGAGWLVFIWLWDLGFYLTMGWTSTIFTSNINQYKWIN